MTWKLTVINHFLATTIPSFVTIKQMAHEMLSEQQLRWRMRIGEASVQIFSLDESHWDYLTVELTDIARHVNISVYSFHICLRRTLSADIIAALQMRFHTDLTKNAFVSWCRGKYGRGMDMDELSLWPGGRNIKHAKFLS